MEGTQRVLRQVKTMPRLELQAMGPPEQGDSGRRPPQPHHVLCSKLNKERSPRRVALPGCQRRKCQTFPVLVQLQSSAHCGSLPATLISRHSAHDVASKRTHAQEDIHFRVLKLLQEQPELKQRELAERLGVSLGKTNYCLRALAQKGQVKLDNFIRSNNRMGYVYGLTPAGLAHKAALTGQFLQRKRTEYEALKAEIETLQAELSEQVQEASAQAPPASASGTVPRAEPTSSLRKPARGKS